MPHGGRDLDRPGVSPWQQMLSARSGTIEPSAAVTVPPAIATACAAAASGSVSTEPGSVRGWSVPSGK